MPWLRDVEAVLQAWYPGQAYGTALAAVLFGDADPGGLVQLYGGDPRGLVAYEKGALGAGESAEVTLRPDHGDHGRLWVGTSSRDLRKVPGGAR